VLSVLAELRESGRADSHDRGNHECWGGADFSARTLGSITSRPLDGELAGWRTRIDHGDGLREVEDRKYRMLRTVLLRSPISIHAVPLAAPGFRICAGGRLVEHAAAIISREMAAPACGVLRKRCLNAPRAPELVVFAHSHVATLERLGAGVYANAGAWMDQAVLSARVAEKVDLCHWTGDGEEVRSSVARPTKKV